MTYMDWKNNSFSNFVNIFGILLNHVSAWPELTCSTRKREIVNTENVFAVSDRLEHFSVTQFLPSLFYTSIFLTVFCVGILFGANIDLIIRKKLNIWFCETHTFVQFNDLMRHGHIFFSSLQVYFKNLHFCSGKVISNLSSGKYQISSF